MPHKKQGATDTPVLLKLKDWVRTTCAGSGDLEKLDAVHIMDYIKAKYPDNSGLKALFEQQAAFANDIDPSYVPPACWETVPLPPATNEPAQEGWLPIWKFGCEEANPYFFASLFL